MKPDRRQVLKALQAAAAQARSQVPRPQKESNMGPKLVGALALSIIVYVVEATRPFAIPFAILAFALVFVIEGVRIVPQQYAWVVERLGRFHEVLEPGLRIIKAPRAGCARW